jgi:hypothetical protein
MRETSDGHAVSRTEWNKNCMYKERDSISIYQYNNRQPLGVPQVDSHLANISLPASA